MKSIRLALPKGKILDESLKILGRLGITAEEDPRSSRKLVIATNRPDLLLLVIRGWDVPTYVEYGAADAGIVGLDVLEEQDKDLYRPLDLGIGACRMVVAEPATMAREDDPATWAKVRVATKYPRLAERYFQAKGIQVEIINLSGSIESAPLTGLSSRIVDLVSTGRTLRENGLVEVDEILFSTAHLVVNRAAMKLKNRPLREFIEALAPCAKPRGRASTS